MGQVRKALIAVAAAPVVTALGAGPAVAATQQASPGTPSVPCTSNCTAHYVTWKNQQTGKYMHVVGGSKADGAQINVYTGSGTCAEHGHTNLQCQEEWAQISTGHSNSGNGEYGYMNVNSGLCLDDPNSAATGPKGIIEVVQYSCGNYPVQRRWSYPTPAVYHDGNPLRNQANGQWACANSNGNVDFSPPFDTFENTDGYWCGWE
jgi:hypothetical protein